MFVVDSENYKPINSTQIAVTCIPLTVILRDIVRDFSPKSTNDEKHTNSNTLPSSPAAAGVQERDTTRDEETPHFAEGSA